MDAVEPMVRITSSVCLKCGEPGVLWPREVLDSDYGSYLPAVVTITQAREGCRIPHTYNCDGQMQIEMEPA